MNWIMWLLGAAGAVAVTGIGLVLWAMWREFRPLWQPVPYTGRHRGETRQTWRGEIWARTQRLQARAARAAFLALVVVPEEADEEGPEEWVHGLIVAERRTDELDFTPATGRRWHVLAPRVLEAQAHLDRRGLRLRQPSPWGSPEDVDVWAGVA